MKWRAVARGRGDRASTLAGHVSIRRPVRRRRGLQVGLGVCQRRANRRKSAMRCESSCCRRWAGGAGNSGRLVPLVDENRILVHHGLPSLRHRRMLGMAAMFKLTGLDQKPALREDIGFSRPATQRGRPAGAGQLGVELLTTSVRPGAALAAYLHELNSSRESLERSIYFAANKQATSSSIPRGSGPRAGGSRLASGHHWHRGDATGRKVSSACGADRVRPIGNQARCGLGAQRGWF